MKAVLLILSATLLSSCAVLVDYKARKIQNNTGVITVPVSFTSSFKTHLGYKYARLDKIDVMRVSDPTSCLNHEAGDSRDPYLKGLLCKSYIYINNKNKIKSFAKNDNNLLEFNFSLNENHGVGDAIWTWTNLITATIIPYRGKRDFNLTVTLIKNGKKLKEYKFRDSFVEWRSILLLPASPFIDGYSAGTEKVLENILSEAMTKLKEDNVI